MQVIQTFSNGTTIEFGDDSSGSCVHRVCSPGQKSCRYVEPYHVAITYAAQYELLFEKESKNSSFNR
jgi:hypothetical protein